MNGQPSYVFKPSTPMAKITFLMDQDHPQKTPFQEVVVSMDGLHSHVKDYITLWLHNPAIQHMQRIAYMDCEGENIYNISKFLSPVNKMLRELKGDPNYIWNPRPIITDENAANKIAVGNILDEDLRKRIVSCQWHYLRCAKKQSSRVHDKDDKKRFKEYSHAFAGEAINLTEYVCIYQSILPICKKYGCLRWLEFWHDHRVHFVPAFHGFGFPGLNLAEAGQSTMRKKMLTLVDVTFDNVIKQMQQDKIYSMTLQNEVKGLGQQRKTMTEIYQEREEEQKQRALHYVQTLQHVMKSKSHLWNRIKAGTYSKSPVQDPAAFYPSEHAKHKYISESEDEDEDKQKPKEKTKGKGKGKGDGKKSTKGVKSGECKTSTSQGTFSTSSSQRLQGQGSSQGAQGQSAQTSPYGPQAPNDYEAEIFKNEVPTVVLYHKSFQVCYPSSCRKQWNPQYMRSPHNMLFQMKTFKKYHNKQGKEVIPKIHTNAYFCFKNLDCLKLVHDGIGYCDLYTGNYYFNQLTLGHVELLKQKGYWDPITQNCNCVIVSGPSVLI